LVGAEAYNSHPDYPGRGWQAQQTNQLADNNHPPAGREQQREGGFIMHHISSRAGAALLAAALHLAALQGAALAQEENPAAVLEAPTVEVVGTTPLPGVGTPVNQVPSNVQAVTGETIQQQQASDLSEFLDRNVGSVNINSGQANPFMPDLNFRGFSASPLLGVPQGMSVFMDGVRINEAFGDTVNWDLIPEAAISTVNLIPGSNPVFGLNTLGGALSVNTKSGKEYPGGSLSLEGGSWGRINPTVEFGGQKGNWDFFVLGNYLEEDGWRDHSSSEIRQLFGKVGYETADFDADLFYSFADNHLEGTQTSPVSLLSVNREVPYTFPDITENRLDFLNLRLSQVFAGDKILAGNVYYRRFKSNNFSSNVNDACEDAAINPGNCAAGSPAEPQGSNDTSEIDTDGYGGTLQFTLLKQLFARDNKFTVGASYDAGRTRFTQLEQIADFSADRGTVATGPFGLETDIDTENDYYGIYATDTFSINAQTHLTLSGRFNRAEVSIRNRNPDPADDDLNGDHHFTRFNPAIGLNWNPNPRFNTWVGYNEGMRVPTPAELTCADENDPCKLPNAFLADPPLEPVVSKTFELGTRGAITANTSYSVSAYRTDLEDDIQFITVSGVNGFFDNLGNTRRQGIEIGLQTRLGKLSLNAAYGFVDATFLDAFLVASPNNSQADANDRIQVESGDRIPGIPQHNFKLRADYAFTPRIFGGVNFIYASDQYARGDENNEDVNGTVPEYFVVNVDARWQITNQLQVFGRISNLLDEEYEVFGVLGENFFPGPGFAFDAANAADEQFRTPGAPRGFFVGVRYDFGRPASTAANRGLDD
jgi:outer membrane receptor protein involved in Fe transport